MPGMDLKTIIDIKKWEEIQDALSRMTGTAIITVDFKGMPVTKHSGRTAFCSVIRENAVFCKRCFKCDALAGLEAVRLNRPYIYLCHCGIVDVAVPVMVGENCLGSVMFGQVRMSHNETGFKVERLVSEISSFRADDGAARQDLLAKYEALPEMEYARIQQIAELIAVIVGYVVEQAVCRHNERLTHEWQLRSAMSAILETGQGELPVPLGPAQEEEPLPAPPGSPVYPALAYAAAHWGENITMNQMADLCHLSPSYFSKLFRRQTGENFTDYVNRHKVMLAKKRLRESADSVTRIAAELGFLDTSYFVCVFKKFEGITPTDYRRNRHP